MLPEAGTIERAALHVEAMQVALAMLDAESNSLAHALYRTHMHFRRRFIDEFGETVPLHELVTDARQLEAYVNDQWAFVVRRSTRQAR